MKQAPKKQTRLKEPPAPTIPMALPAAGGSYDDFDGFVEFLRANLRTRHADIRADLRRDLETFLADGSEPELFFMSFALSIWEGQRTHSQERGPEELAEAFRLAGDELPAGPANAQQQESEMHAHMTADGMTVELTARRAPKCRRQAAHA